MRRPGTSVLAASLAVFVACSGQVGGTGDDDEPGDSNADDGDDPGDDGVPGDDEVFGGSGGRGGSGGSPPASAGLGRLTDAEAKACSGTLDPGAIPPRRLTRREYNNTVRDLLGDTSNPAKDFPSDERVYNFDNNAAALSVSPALAEQYQLKAEKLAEAAITNPKVCEGGCTKAKVIEEFGLKAFRRPLEAAEITRYGKVWDQGAKTSPQLAARLVIEAMLQSAPFLYRLETSGTATSGVVKVSPYEMASRLSYLLWASMPDAELFQAAKDNKLGTPAEVRAQVDRMLKDEKAQRMVESFHEQWLALAEVFSLDKDKELFAAWQPTSMADMKAETAAFVGDVFTTNGSLETLLKAPYTYVNKNLATLYGLSTTGHDTSFKRVDLNPQERLGILTQGSILAHEAKSNQSSPVLRGKFVRDAILCSPPPPPPMNIEIKPPDLDPNLTTRQRFDMHRDNEACRDCHMLLDAVGLGFENFDAVGKYRAKENGQTIDASGELVETDVDGKFVGVSELADKLSSSNQVKRCYVTSWYRFAYGKVDAENAKADQCTLHQLDARFAQGKLGLKAMLIALTETDAFFYRRAGGAQ